MLEPSESFSNYMKRLPNETAAFCVQNATVFYDLLAKEQCMEANRELIDAVSRKVMPDAFLKIMTTFQLLDQDEELTWCSLDQTDCFLDRMQALVKLGAVKNPSIFQPNLEVLRDHLIYRNMAEAAFPAYMKEILPKAIALSSRINTDAAQQLTQDFKAMELGIVPSLLQGKTGLDDSFQATAFDILTRNIGAIGGTKVDLDGMIWRTARGLYTLVCEKEALSVVRMPLGSPELAAAAVISRGVSQRVMQAKFKVGPDETNMASRASFETSLMLRTPTYPEAWRRVTARVAAKKENV